MKFQRILLTAIVGICGGLLFSKLHIPVPWLLGPLLFVLMGNSLRSEWFYWPKSYKSIGMVLIGYTIGQALTGEAVREIGRQLPYMFGMTTLLILLSAGIAWVVSKKSAVNYPTALLSSIPGGMTQIIMMAEEMKSVNLTVVTVTQTIRLLFIVIGMPLLLTTFHLTTVPTQTEHVSEWMSFETVLILFICILLAFIGKKYKFPTAFLLVPALVTAILQNIGVVGVELANPILSFAQFMIGINIGMMMKPRELEQKGRTIALAVTSAAALFIVAMLLGIIFAQVNHLDYATALLSLAPGGMDQMGAIAHAIHANLSIVAGYQVFRAFYILFVIQPIIAYFLRKQIIK